MLNTSTGDVSRAPPSAGLSTLMLPRPIQASITAPGPYQRYVGYADTSHGGNKLRRSRSPI